MVDLWKHRNQGFFSYNGKETILKSEAGKVAVKDWNRQVNAGDKCGYFINGIKLSDLRAQMLKNGECKQLEFAGRADLRRFFRTHLFKDLSPAKARIAAEHASLQFAHGIQHATYYYATHCALEKFPNIKMSQSAFTVNFDSTSDGVRITEHNKYREWMEILPAGKSKKHTRSETQEPYAESHTVYSFTPKKIILKDLIIDCPSSRLAPIFDQRSEETQTIRGGAFWRALLQFAALLKFIKRYDFEDHAKPEDVVIYRHPKPPR